MKKYEAMFIVKPDLSDDDRKSLFAQIKDIAVKHNAAITAADQWGERRRLTFTIKKQVEGIYFLMNFTMPPENVVKLKYLYGLNDNILRTMILVLE